MYIRICISYIANPLYMAIGLIFSPTRMKMKMKAMFDQRVGMGAGAHIFTFIYTHIPITCVCICVYICMYICILYIHSNTPWVGVYLASVVEYLCFEVLELAGNEAGNNRRKRITPHDVFITTYIDAEFSTLFKNVTIAAGGVNSFHAGSNSTITKNSQDAWLKEQEKAISHEKKLAKMRAAYKKAKLAVAESRGAKK